MKFLILFIIGALTSTVIIQLLKTSMLNRSWSYPVLLASFPLFYMLFAMWINDKTSLKNEFFAGLVFFAIAALYVRYRRPWVEYLLITGFFLHALYDVTHDLFFLNMGVPIWWPEFCGTVDLFIGLYLLYRFKQNKQIQIYKS